MIKQALLQELQLEADNTRKLFDSIPNDVLSYKPNDFNWSIGQLAAHTAEVYNWWANTLEEDVFEMSTYKYDKGDISDIKFIKEKLEENIAKATKSLENFSEEKFMDKWSMQNEGVNIMPEMPRVQVVRSFLMNHIIIEES